eukprot:6730812-Prymnesium_polylepis.1
MIESSFIQPISIYYDAASSDVGWGLRRVTTKISRDSSSHHPFISTLFTKSFQHFKINFWAELSPFGTTSRASPSK